MNIESNTRQTQFSVETRRQNLSSLEQDIFDLLIIGGGITGAAIACQAAQRGYKVALVEQGDFASGSSSKSSKLIHGGLRYLADLRVGLVFEACRQRQRLLKQAPHLIHRLPFILTFSQNQSRWPIRLALALYDAFAVVNHHLTTDSPGWPQHQFWSAEQTIAQEPVLGDSKLAGAACYYDCAADDARLTLMTLLNAHRLGAVLTNYTKVIGFTQTKGRITGVQIHDRQGDVEIEIRARLTISATGPWTDKLLKLACPEKTPWLKPTKGIHLIVCHERLPSRAALTFSAPGDGRYLFAVPWGNRVILGTTDTTFMGDPNNVYATSEEVAYLLEAVQKTFPTADLNERDILSTYAGLRPLLRQTNVSSNSHRSREHCLREVTPGLLTIAGGKFTTHQTMAHQTVEWVARDLTKIQPQPSVFSALPGGNISDWAAFQSQQQTALTAATHLPNDIIANLLTTYGSEVGRILSLLAERPALAQRLYLDLPIITAQIIYAIQYEMALTLTDVLDRRTHIFDKATDQGLGVAQSVANLMATKLGWTPQEQATQVAYYRYEVAKSRFWREGF